MTTPDTIHRPDDDGTTDTILRPDDDGTPDEFCIACDYVHIERMDDGVFWMGIYRGEERVAISFWTKRGAYIGCTVNEDELGLRDDSDEWKEVADDYA